MTRKTHNYIVRWKSKITPTFFIAYFDRISHYESTLNFLMTILDKRIIVRVQLDPGDGGAREKKVLNALQHETTAHQG